MIGYLTINNNIHIIIYLKGLSRPLFVKLDVCFYY